MLARFWQKLQNERLYAFKPFDDGLPVVQTHALENFLVGSSFFLLLTLHELLNCESSRVGFERRTSEKRDVEVIVVKVRVELHREILATELSDRIHVADPRA